MERRVINPWTWQDAFGFVQAVEITGGGQVLFCSGQTSNDADGNVLHAGDMRAQINAALDNLETVLQASGFELAHVVRLNMYTTDVDLFLANYDALVSRLAAAGCRQSATLLGVTRLAFPDWLVELEATAVKE
jgi:enamine deaminase RidA (YjgF/YER057c/UK114 family)